MEDAGAGARAQLLRDAAARDDRCARLLNVVQLADFEARIPLPGEHLFADVVGDGRVRPDGKKFSS